MPNLALPSVPSPPLPRNACRCVASATQLSLVYLERVATIYPLACTNYENGAMTWWVLTRNCMNRVMAPDCGARNHGTNPIRATLLTSYTSAAFSSPASGPAS